MPAVKLSYQSFNSYCVGNKQGMCNFVPDKLRYNKPKLSTMKKNHLLLLVVALMMTFSFTSCLNDDFDGKAKQNRPTQAELKAASKTIQGTYQGKLFTYTFNSTNNTIQKKDSVITSWEITDDTTLVVKKFPSKLLANNVTNADLKQAIEALPDQEVKCAVSIFNVNPILFYIAPYRLDLGKLTYGGKTHDVSIGFIFNPNNTYGGYDNAKKITGFRLIESVVLIDGTADKSLYRGFEIFDFRSEPKK